MSKMTSLTGHSTLGKAREINANEKIYGAFAEIGAGQEVARFFFQAGKASQTIAKTISAYDMIYSDEIYGKETSGRYVCESRVLKMLDKEYSLLQRRLSKHRGDRTTFFAFANTVATGDSEKKHPHGWMGVRFQTEPGGPMNDIVMHVRMLDRYRLQQQEVLGVLGVNLVATAFYGLKDPAKLLECLTDNIKTSQVSIDLLRVSGPALAHINNHEINYELVQKYLADAILFGPGDKISTVSDEVYGKPIMLLRGRFNPITKTHADIIEKSRAQFEKDFSGAVSSKKSKILVLKEVTTRAFTKNDKFDKKLFFQTVDKLCKEGHQVLVSNFEHYFELKNFLRQYTHEPLIMMTGAGQLPEIFEPSRYSELDGGMLEGLGKLLDEKTKLYVYPMKTKDSCTTVKSFFASPKVQPIYKYFVDQKQVCDVAGCDDIEEQFLNFVL